MKRTSITTALIVTIGFAFSCNNPKNEIQAPEQIEKVAHTDSHQHTESGISLDDGKRWIANPETTKGIHNMRLKMRSFSQKQDLAAYAVLNKKLQAEFTMVFQKCTMTGEAHNQLHNFLIPINTLFETLSSDDLKQCQDTFEELNRHLATYDRYFK